MTTPAPPVYRIQAGTERQMSNTAFLRIYHESHKHQNLSSIGWTNGFSSCLSSPEGERWWNHNYSVWNDQCTVSSHRLLNRRHETHTLLWRKLYKRPLYVWMTMKTVRSMVDWLTFQEKEWEMISSWDQTHVRVVPLTALHVKGQAEVFKTWIFLVFF